MKKKRRVYTKYPKIVTVTCVPCGKKFDVLLKNADQKRPRYYCTEGCEKDYLAMARKHANATRRGNGMFGGERGEYQPLFSRVLKERPAARHAASKKEKSPDDIANDAKKEALAKRDREYWASLRRCKGLPPIEIEG